MNFEKNFDVFDKEFLNIENLKWLPWIGHNYPKTKIIILGESQYEDGDDWQEDNINATRILINNRFSGHRGQAYSNVVKVLLSIDSPTQADNDFVWESTSFWNLVPRLMRSREERPKDEDFDNGWKLFFEIIEILEPKPTTCIVLGKSSLGRLGYLLNNNQILWNRNVEDFYKPEKVITLSKNDNQIKLIFINHPSGSFGFDYKKWAKLVSENVQIQQYLMER
ncbi:MAG: hypothetical protein QM535_19375 [Limnohabitans sp.]|nr:hypothetical protein [Limnohabitans sp.]